MEAGKMDTTQAKILARLLGDWAGAQVTTQETLVFDIIGRAFSLTAQTGAQGFLADWHEQRDIPCSDIKRLREMDMARPTGLYSTRGGNENGVQ